MWSPQDFNTCPLTVTHNGEDIWKGDRTESQNSFQHGFDHCFAVNLGQITAATSVLFLTPLNLKPPIPKKVIIIKTSLKKKRTEQKALISDLLCLALTFEFET